jgi:hypothetical protein
MSSAYSKNGETRDAYYILVVKSFAKRSLWRPRMRWKDNVKVEFREIIVRELDGTGSRICPVVDFGVIGINRSLISIYGQRLK